MRSSSARIDGEFSGKSTMIVCFWVWVRKRSARRSARIGSKYRTDSGQAPRLQARSIEQVLDHGCQVVGLFFDNGQAVTDNVFIPFGIFAPQCADIAFDQGNRCFEFVADDGNESVLISSAVRNLVISRTVTKIFLKVPSAASSGHR